MLHWLKPNTLYLLLFSLIPLLIYLLLKRKKKIYKFSSLYIFKKILKTAKKRSRIRNIYLLIIRTLIIFLLVVFLAKPYISKKQSPVKFSDLHHLILIDNDYMSNLKYKDKSTLDRNIEIIHQILKNNPKNIKYTLYPSCSKILGDISRDSLNYQLSHLSSLPISKNNKTIEKYIKTFNKNHKNSLVTCFGFDHLFSSENNNRINFKNKLKYKDFSLDSAFFKTSKKDLKIKIFITGKNLLSEKFKITISDENKVIRSFTENLNTQKQIVSYSISNSTIGNRLKIELSSDKDQNSYNNCYYLTNNSKNIKPLLFLINKDNKITNQLLTAVKIISSDLKYKKQSIQSITGLNLKKYQSIFLFPDDTYKSNIKNFESLYKYNKNSGSIVIIPVFESKIIGTKFFEDYFFTFNKNSDFTVKKVKNWEKIDSFDKNYFEQGNLFEKNHNSISTPNYFNKLIVSTQIKQIISLKNNSYLKLLASKYIPVFVENKSNKNRFTQNILLTSLGKTWSNLADNGFVIPLIEAILTQNLSSKFNKNSFYLQSKDLKQYLNGNLYLQTENSVKIDLLSDKHLLPGFYKINKNGKKNWIALNFLRKKSSGMLSNKIITDKNKLIEYYAQLFDNNNILNWIILSILSSLVLLELILTIFIRKRANS